MTVPRLVVFDLDACLWDTEMKFLGGPPERVGDAVVATVEWDGKYGEVPVIPPTRTSVSLHPGAACALKQLDSDPRFSHTRVACASKTWKVEYSLACLRALTLGGRPVADYFCACEVYPSTKDAHFEALHAKTGVAYSDMLFFDDCTWKDNFEDVARVGDVRCVRTPDGMTVEAWEKGLLLFADAAAPLSLTPSSSEGDLH